MSLPPIPISKNLGHARGYTPAQLREYGQQCREAGLEEAAIDAERNGHLWSGAPAKAFFNLAEQIRSLK